MCDICGKEWTPPNGSYPCGPCPDDCPNCGEAVSPCCGAKIIHSNDRCDDDCEICQYCGTGKCKECGQHVHCGGCV